MALIKEKYKQSIWFHLLLMLLLAVVFYIIFFSSLGRITGHGEQMKMPVLVDKTFGDAVKILEKEGFDIDVDSAFDIKKDAGIVLSQMPDTGAFVKRGRTVFIVVNKSQAPLTPMPDLMGVSYRSADMVLRSNKLRLGDTIHRPDIADGAILEQMYNGKVIQAGDMIPQGSKITLVIGDGLGNVEFDVPDVVGMSYAEGSAVLSASGLQFIDVWEGPITDSLTAVIYHQYPDAKNDYGGTNRIKQGEFMDIKIRQTPVNKSSSPTQQQGNKPPKKPVNNSNDDGDW